jgi:hypothetical protein
VSDPLANLTLIRQKRRALHENGENPANPISRIENCEFFPRRLSAKPAQVSPTHSIKSLRKPTES